MFKVRLPAPDAWLLLTARWEALGPFFQAVALGLVTLLPLLLILWLYLYELRVVPRLTATTLLGLRVTALLLLLFLVCLQPVYARETVRELPGRVLVAVDLSDSMTVVDPQRPPADKLRLAKALKLARDLASDEQLEEWAQAHARKEEPRWVGPDEARDDPAKRRQLEQERRKQHDDVCGRVDELSRKEAALRVLDGRGVNLLARLAEKHEVELVGFNRQAWEAKKGPDGKYRLAELFAGVDQGPQGIESAFTDLRRPLRRAIDRSGPGQGKVLGVVLLTDGQQNAGDGPANEATARELAAQLKERINRDRRGVPIFAIGLGARTPPPWLSILSVQGPNHTVFKGVDADVKVRFHIAGRKTQKFRLELYRKGKDGQGVKVGEREVEHAGQDRAYEETITVRLDEAGRQELTATVVPVEEKVVRGEVGPVQAAEPGPAHRPANERSRAVGKIVARAPGGGEFAGGKAEVTVPFSLLGEQAGPYFVDLFAGTGEGRRRLARQRVDHPGEDRNYEEKLAAEFDAADVPGLTATVTPALAEVTVRFEIKGQEPQPFDVELAQGDGPKRRVAGLARVNHGGADRKYELKVPAHLDPGNAQGLSVTVRPASPRRTTTVAVSDDKAKVLLVDGEARWEYHYLATALDRDPTVEYGGVRGPVKVVFDQPRLNRGLTSEQAKELGLPRQELPRGPDALTEFQCIILGDVSPEKLPLAERQRLERYVADTGGTLVVVAGARHMPRGFPATMPDGQPDPLRRLLPIEVPEELAPTEGFPITRTREGREQRFMGLDDDVDETEGLWAGRPRPWAWAVVGRAKRAATPLARVPLPGDDRLPLDERDRHRVVVARHNYGFGRVLYVGIDSTWRWRYRVGDKHHHRFWGQVVKWAAADKPLQAGNRFLRFGTPQPNYVQGEAVTVTARLNEALGPVKPNLVASARVLRLPERPGEAEQAVAVVPLARPAARPRELEGQYSSLPPGRYAVELDVPDLGDKTLAPGREGQPARPLRSDLTVLPPRSDEMVKLQTDWDELNALAAHSGGLACGPEGAEEVLEKIVKNAVKEVNRDEQRLYEGWWWMLAIPVTLLSAEWVLRKLSGLP